MMDDVLDYDNSAYSSYKAIAGVAVPSIVLNAAAPLTGVVQTAFLGYYVGNHALGAYGACTIIAGFATRIFNFLVDGVSAKTGKSVGRRAWRELGARVKHSLLFAVAMGVLGLSMLMLLKNFLMEGVLNLSGDILDEAYGFWTLRALLVPFLLLNMSLSGILQGFRCVKTVAMLNTVQALIEMGGSVFVIMFEIQFQGSRLMSVGVVSLVSYLLSVVSGCVLIFVMKPPEAGASFSLWIEMFYPELSSSSSYSSLRDSLVGTDNEDDDDDLEEEEDETLLDFVKDGLNMLIRSLIMQSTFFIALVCSTRLGNKYLAAHSIISQLWLLLSYIVDGFAAAAIVLGSRLGGQAYNPARAADAKMHLQRLIIRVLSAGLITGVSAAIVFQVKADAIMGLFTRNEKTLAILKNGTWQLLSLVQPLNSLVFVYDGLMYASQSFTFIRNYFLVGFFVVFMPIIGLQISVWHTLWGVWMAKAFFNVWRCLGAAYLIHYVFLAEFDAECLRRSRSSRSIINIDESAA
ncbi:hypothetical protein M9435_006494 [Picochlorum sp. BPE23]|nr:hypothetical protein M9435_006494 [Picochlorum sp. BPE23]